MVILLLLRTGPMTGYAIRETCRTHFAHFWAESFGQIYPALKRLEADGYIKPAGGPNEGRRQTYAITMAGLAYLRQWLAEPPAPRNVRDELFLKFLCGGEAGHAVQRTHVRQARGDIERRLRAARAGMEEMSRLAGTLPDSAYWFLVARAGELTAEAMLKWCDEAEAMLESKEAGND